MNISSNLVSPQASEKPVLPSWEKTLSQEQHLCSCNKGCGDTEYINHFSLLTPQIPKDDFMLGPLTKFPVICSKQTDCSYQDAWNSTSSWKVLEDLWGGSRHRETNAAEVTRVQVMKIFAISYSLWLSVHKEKKTGGASCPELQAQLHAQATQGQTCPGEKHQDLNFGLRDSSVGYSQDKRDLVTHLPVLSVQHFPTSPLCHSARCLWENTSLVPCTYSHPLKC